MTNMQSIEEMLAVLKSNPNVLGLVEYGSSHESILEKTGDYDLFVVLEDKAYDVESLHFHIATIPVDLNIRSLQEIQDLRYAEGFETALLDGRIIYDPTKKVAQALEGLRMRQKAYHPGRPSEHSVAFARHGHRHALDKIKGRIETMPLLCKFLLNTNIYWLVERYFDVRNLSFRGEKHALNYFKENEPDIYQGIQDFYSATSLQRQIEMSERLTDLVLKPVGGQWKDEEVLAFGNSETKDLQKKGRDLFQRLFYHASNPKQSNTK